MYSGYSAKDAIPAFRRGRWEVSLDTVPVHDGLSATLSLVPKIVLNDDIQWIKSAVKNGDGQVPRTARAPMLRAALEKFASGTVVIPGVGSQSFDAFVDSLWTYVGLPRSLTQAWAGLLVEVGTAKHTDEFREARPSDLSLISLPSNTFVCLEACIDQALAGGTHWIRPSQREPFSAVRFVACMLEAGWPGNLLGFYPFDKTLISYAIEKVDSAVLFGGDDIQQRYAGRTGVVVKGPGRACAIIERETSGTVDWLMRLVAGNAGRFCTNVGTILSVAPIAGIGEMLAMKLDAISLDAREETVWPVTHWLDAKFVEGVERWIRGSLRSGDSLLTARPLRIIGHNGRHVLTPSLVRLAEPEGHPLIGVELPFPFAVIGRVTPDQAIRLTAQSQFIYLEGK